jgi:hypothetical protein
MIDSIFHNCVYLLQMHLFIKIRSFGCTPNGLKLSIPVVTFIQVVLLNSVVLDGQAIINDLK